MWLLPGFYLAALIANAAPDMGTCTQGDAGQLFLVILAAPAQLLGMLGLSMTKYIRWAVLACLPLIPVLIRQMVFALRLTKGLIIDGMSACGFLMNDSDWEFDGSEVSYVKLWIVVCMVLPLIACGLAVWRLAHQRKVDGPAGLL